MASRSDPITAHGKDPLASFNFWVEVDGGGEIKGRFTEVSGLKGDAEEFEIKEGGRNSHTHRLPGRVSWGPVTLKKGLGDEKFFHEWWDKVVKTPKDCRKKVSIILMNDKWDEVRRWELEDAWPKSWETATLNANSSEMAIETLVLNHKGVVKES
jgi:phage tail-like protein